MTTVSMKYQTRNSFKQHVGNISSWNTYNVTVECEENEHYDLEVDANTYGEACAIAESIAQEKFVDILYIQVEQVA
ncbi:MAG: hypothetical protein J6I61_03270 [Prevotella sp.]|nr:hypothetical protein [Prevotella sp.]